MDGVYGTCLFTALTGPSLISGLRGTYGPAVQAFYKNYPPLLYTLLFGLGALYNSLGAYAASATAPAASWALPEKGMRWWQAAIVGWLPFCLPMALMSLLFR